MTIVNNLREEMPVARISRTMRIPRSFIYYNRSDHTGSRKPRVSSDVEPVYRSIQ